MKTTKIILMRHGESQWNQLNQFTGWQDPKLSKNGIIESIKAANKLKKNGFIFDLAYTSILKRAISTLWNILEVLDQLWIPVYKSWQLNERNYGALEGLNKEDTIKKYGLKQVTLWRRSFDISPPALESFDPRNPIYDKKYQLIKENNIPKTESLKDTMKRVIPYWENIILPELKNKKKIILVAHGNSLRALIKYLNNISDEDIVKFDIPTGSPIIYEFSKNIEPLKYFYL